ncbi:MAG: rane protein [Patescibacteria group bacterium]|nr:rane protein [Patescibacteria group bacterium]
MIQEYRADRVGLYSAASAYYAIFSLAPITIFLSLAYAFFLGKNVANDIAFGTAYRFFGETGAKFYESATTTVLSQSFGLIALVAIILFVYGMSRLFGVIHSTFADIFNFEIGGESVVQNTVKGQLSSFVYLLFLLLFILFLAVGNVAFSLFGNIISSFVFVESTANLVVFGNFMATFVCTFIALAIIYRYVSDRRIGWWGAVFGGIFGALLFSLTSTLFGLYVAHSVVIPLYGAGSFVVALVLWVYYSLQAMFLGAEVSKVYECQYPRHRQKVCL